MTDAMEYLKQVEDRAKEMYALSNQGEWQHLHPSLQRFWIDAADKELRPKLHEETNE